MNWDRMEGQWKQRRGRAIRHWGTMMNDELAAIAGKYEELVGKLQEKYGLANEASKRQVEEFAKIVKQLRQSNARLRALHLAHKKTPSAQKTTKRLRAKARTRSRTNA